jgi:uncharacterized repeat protein (TIGR01451 family)
MKRFLLVAVIAAGFLGMALVADAYVDRLNTCTSTYQLTGGSVTPSGSDTAIVRVLSNPNITVTKSVYNYRTAISDANLVNARSGDSIMFTIQWWNTGENAADTIILTDYVPTGLTLGTTSLGDTNYNTTGDTPTQAGTVVYETVTGAAGTVPGPASSGTMTFRVTVQ